MNALTLEWVDKAEGDLRTAVREAAVLDLPNADAVCFHAQQCVEKYLKALLQESSLPVPRTHDLAALLADLASLAPELGGFHADLDYLTTFAVETRYPGSGATRQDATRAVQVMNGIRATIREHLGLP